MSPSTAKLLADAIVVAHLAFVVFALFGAVLALRWRWVALAHLPSVAWVIYVAASNAICPLTPLENDLRRHAGDAGYEGGFVDHYLMPVLYPDGLTPEIQRRMGGGILLFNVACYAGVVWRWRAAARRRRGDSGARGFTVDVPAEMAAAAAIEPKATLHVVVPDDRADDRDTTSPPADPADPAERPIATSAP